MDIEAVRLMYSGLPKIWKDKSSLKELNEARRESLLRVIETKVVSSTTGGSMFIQGDGAIFMHLLLEAKVNPDNIRGLDFKKFFSETLSESEKPTVPTSHFVFVYNIGKEQAVNSNFSGRLLEGIISSCQNNNQWVILVSDNAYSWFAKQYGISIVNTLSFRQSPKQNIF
jgi:hypothetical protein